MRLRRPTVTATAAPAPGGRSRLLLLFACLATAVASVALPGQQPHRTELAAVALLAALLLLRRHHHATEHPDSGEPDATQEDADSDTAQAAQAERLAERSDEDQHPAIEQPEGEHPAAQPDLERQADPPEVFQAPTRRRFQSRRSHAHELALAQISQTLAAQEQRLADLNRAQTVAKLRANDHLDALHERLAELETRTDQHDEALQAIHDRHADQLNRLQQSITRHTHALQQLEHTLGP